MNELNYRKEDHYHPLDGPQRVEAEVFAQISEKPGLFLEGTWFTDENTMYFVTTRSGQLVKLDMATKQTQIVYEDKDSIFVSVKTGPDGKFYLCAVGADTNKGKIVVLNPDYSFSEILCNGYQIDDITFDSKGGFYFTNYEGTESDRAGGIGYVGPDRKKVTMVYPNLAGPNGVSLSPDEKWLWVTETRAGNLNRFDIYGGRSSVPYHFSGGIGPDSCEIDEDGNLYVAFLQHGCVTVFNALGHHIADIVIPGRENGKYLDVTHPTVRPGTKEVYITVNDESGCAIYRCGSFAPGFYR